MRSDTPDPRIIAVRLANHSNVARATRGRYLVEHVAGCGGCHSPKGPDGRYDTERWLSGVDCFVDIDPRDPGRGCVSTPNLTQHETGLKNRSDRWPLVPGPSRGNLKGQWTSGPRL